MKKIVIALSIALVVSIGFSLNASAEEGIIPAWIKNTALWYGQDQVSDTEFLNAIQFMISNDLIKVPQEKSSSSPLDNVLSTNPSLADLLPPIAICGTCDDHRLYSTNYIKPSFYPKHSAEFEYIGHLYDEGTTQVWIFSYQDKKDSDDGYGYLLNLYGTDKSTITGEKCSSAKFDKPFVKGMICQKNNFVIVLTQFGGAYSNFGTELVQITLDRI